MPRVTQREQYKRHQVLRNIWSREPSKSCFADVSPADQWKIHRFYRPAEFLEFSEFREHLRHMKHKNPELVHVVGKLFRQIELSFIHQQEAALAHRLAGTTLQSAKPKKISERKIVARAVVRPEPEIMDRMARAVLQMARERMKEQPSKLEREESSHNPDSLFS